MALIYGVWEEKLYQSVSKAGSGGLSYKKDGFDHVSGKDPGYTVRRNECLNRHREMDIVSLARALFIRLMNPLLPYPHLLAGLLILMMTGCVSEPKPVELTTTPPKSFSQSGQHPLPDKWWIAFGDKDLDRILGSGLLIRHL